ncbi:MULTISPECIES: hypothetical protein [Janthinobacterium]|uniref:hypothetical protein n=1 Tax=Janthinobacterium TaxID=29580 RepID=UPI001C5B0DBB|nr:MULTISPECIES: hypothetical protein [Janthinobacterium]MBW3509647.1 hypothetical protein [Janthinobacterium sp. NKUCC06_STL]MCA1859768.1 hypothetical protein [Janthinobacterium lividum]
MHSRPDDQCSSEKGAPNNANGAPQLEHEVLDFFKKQFCNISFSIASIVTILKDKYRHESDSRKLSPAARDCKQGLMAA